MRAVPLSRRSHCRIPCRVAVVAEEAEGARQAAGVLQEVAAHRVVGAGSRHRQLGAAALSVPQRRTEIATPQRSLATD